MDGMGENNDHADPSPVVFVRNLPVDVTERELADLAMPFGTIKSMILTRKSGIVSCTFLYVCVRACYFESSIQIFRGRYFLTRFLKLARVLLLV